MLPFTFASWEQELSHTLKHLQMEKYLFWLAFFTETTGLCSRELSTCLIVFPHLRFCFICKFWTWCRNLWCVLGQRSGRAISPVGPQNSSLQRWCSWNCVTGFIFEIHSSKDKATVSDVKMNLPCGIRWLWKTSLYAMSCLSSVFPKSSRVSRSTSEAALADPSRSVAQVTPVGSSLQRCPWVGQRRVHFLGRGVFWILLKGWFGTKIVGLKNGGRIVNCFFMH